MSGECTVPYVKTIMTFETLEWGMNIMEICKPPRPLVCATESREIKMLEGVEKGSVNLDIFFDNGIIFSIRNDNSASMFYMGNRIHPMFSSELLSWFGFSVGNTNNNFIIRRILGNRLVETSLMDHRVTMDYKFKSIERKLLITKKDNIMTANIHIVARPLKSGINV